MAFEKNMSKNSGELSLDVGSVFVPNTVSDIPEEVSVIYDFSQKSSRLDFHVRSLEEEMGKIDAFKRELPHCMHLLKDAIETLKKERLRLKGKEKVAVMEDLIPLKSIAEGNGVKPSNDVSDKKNWMSCVKLWSTPVQYENNFDTGNHSSILSLKSMYEEDKEEASVYGYNFSMRRGAFVPFKKSSLVKMEEKRAVPVEGLSISIPVAEVRSIDLSLNDAAGFVRPHLQQLRLHKKQRRCWSPELHKRFVDVLLQLGGAQTATPKQIRDLMKVDGLTNDEVKSHLQKYRLHIRKLSSSSADTSWLAQNEHGHLSKRFAAHSGSPQDHLHHGGSTKGGSTICGESMEDDLDDKSENHS